jgi:molybdopterin-guanine dinucleotide biosynthesis protein A
MVEKISAAILAGGSGSRFNSIIKPKIVINGEMIISRTLSVLSDIFNEIIIVTNTPSEFEEFSFCKIVCDEIPASGPLGGIHSALKSSSNEAVFIFAGDMPFPDAQIILRMTAVYENEICDALIPMIEGYIEPLHAVYSISLVKAIEGHLAGKSRIAVVDFVKKINARYFQLEKSAENIKAFTNVNSPEDIITAQKRLSQKPF